MSVIFNVHSKEAINSFVPLPFALEPGPEDLIHFSNSSFISTSYYDVVYKRSTSTLHDLGVFGSSDSVSSLDGDRRRSHAAAAEKDETGYYSSSDESHDARSTRSAAADASDTAADEGCAASREDVDAVPAAPAGDDDVVPASDDTRSSTRAEENS